MKYTTIILLLTIAACTKADQFGTCYLQTPNATTCTADGLWTVTRLDQTEHPLQSEQCERIRQGLLSRHEAHELYLVGSDTLTPAQTILCKCL
jgi:hypothetical protein